MPEPARNISLAAESRSIARARMLAAARLLLAQKGFSLTIDDVALAAGLSRRTVFRYFATRGALIVAACDEIWTEAQALLPAPPGDGVDLEAWLTRTTVTFHQLNLSLGATWWDLHAPVHAPDAEIEAWRDGWLRSRQATVTTFSAAVWRAAGGIGTIPPWLMDVLSLHLSAFAVQGMSLDGARSPQETGSVSARLMWMALREALAQPPVDGEVV